MQHVSWSQCPSNHLLHLRLSNSNIGLQTASFPVHNTKLKPRRGWYLKVTLLSSCDSCNIHLHGVASQLLLLYLSPLGPVSLWPASASSWSSFMQVSSITCWCWHLHEWLLNMPRQAGLQDCCLQYSSHAASHTARECLCTSRVRQTYCEWAALHTKCDVYGITGKHIHHEPLKRLEL